MKLKKIFLPILALALVLVACSGENNQAPENKQPANEVQENLEPEENNAPQEEAENTPEEEEEEEEAAPLIAQVYFPTTEYIAEGDDTDPYRVVDLDLNEDGDFIGQVLDRLAQPGPEGTEPIGLDHFIISDTQFEDGTVVLNFDGSSLKGGSLDEEVLVHSLVNSFLSIDIVDQVAFRVDSEPAETLMGHVSVETPFSAPIAL